MVLILCYTLHNICKIYIDRQNNPSIEPSARVLVRDTRVALVSHILENKCNCICFLCWPEYGRKFYGIIFCIIFVMIVLHGKAVSVVTPQDRHEYFIIPKMYVRECSYSVYFAMQMFALEYSQQPFGFYILKYI